MKVFIVGAGNYSSWHVIGAFSTLEKAQEFTAKIWTGHPGYDDEPGRYILELELDAPPDLHWIDPSQMSDPRRVQHEDPSHREVQHEDSSYWET